MEFCALYALSPRSLFCSQVINIKTIKNMMCVIKKFHFLENVRKHMKLYFNTRSLYYKLFITNFGVKETLNSIINLQYMWSRHTDTQNSKFSVFKYKFQVSKCSTLNTELYCLILIYYLYHFQICRYDLFCLPGFYNVIKPSISKNIWGSSDECN